jgi:hypothetical protein
LAGGLAGFSLPAFLPAIPSFEKQYGNGELDKTPHSSCFLTQVALLRLLGWLVGWVVSGLLPPSPSPGTSPHSMQLLLGQPASPLMHLKQQNLQKPWVVQCFLSKARIQNSKNLGVFKVFLQTQSKTNGFVKVFTLLNLKKRVPTADPLETIQIRAETGFVRNESYKS